MNIDYYNTVNQLQLVNNWCVVKKLYISSTLLALAATLIVLIAPPSAVP